MTRPLLLVVDHDLDALARTEAELARRFGADFRVRGESDSAVALHHLELAAERRDPVALVLADPWLPGLGGAELLGSVRTLHPDAARALLVPLGRLGRPRDGRGDAAGHVARRIDYYVLKPWCSPDELFNRTVGEFVHVWSRDRRTAAAGRSRSVRPRHPRGHEVRSVLTRNGIPHALPRREPPKGGAARGRRGPAPGAGRPARHRLAPRRQVPARPDQLRSAGRGIGPASGPPGGARDECATSTCSIVGAGPAGLAAAVYALVRGAAVTLRRGARDARRPGRDAAR